MEAVHHKGITTEQYEHEPQNEFEGSIEEEGPDEEAIIRAHDNPNVYVTKVLKSAMSKSGRKKKDPRVYNSRHFCLICKKFTKDFSQHVFARSHSNMPAVVELKGKPRKERKQLITLLRLKGDHENNLRTIERGKGEIILGRRLGNGEETFVSRNFGPCPSCWEWMKVSTLPRHRSRCLAKGAGSNPLLNQVQIQTQSQHNAAGQWVLLPVFVPNPGTSFLP